VSIAASIKSLTLIGFLAAVVVPQTALAAEPGTAAPPPPGPIGVCLEESGGNADAFIACLEAKADDQDLPEGWRERVKAFLDSHPDWAERLRARLDRREQMRDRREDFRDRRENRRDRWEDRHDQNRNWEDWFDRREDRRDRRENFRDRWEDRRDAGGGL
jgi:hypothetical protein